MLSCKGLLRIFPNLVTREGGGGGQYFLPQTIFDEIVDGSSD